MAQENPTIGYLLNKDSEINRDAIHIAIAPVIAGENLMPGDPIKVKNNIAFSASQNSIGIVDPFLRAMIHTDERFYCFLNPYTVTSLRHQWEHPAFVNNEESIKFMTFFANACEITVEKLMAAAKEYLLNDAGDTTLFLGVDTPYEYLDDFWKHYSILTGSIIPKKTCFISCAC